MLGGLLLRAGIARRITGYFIRSMAEVKTATSNPPTYYDILGVHRDASNADIRRAYHRLALRFKNESGPSEEELKQITTAYGELSDETRRAAYNERSNLWSHCC